VVGLEWYLCCNTDTTPISSKRDLATFMFCLIIVFLILSFLEIRADRRQKSISVEFSFGTVFAFKHPVSAAYVIVFLTIA